ncbi:RpiR family transcriptional regulator [Lactiplantibacillus plantarum EGD-AQ4]|nr:MurR/RpiR family transcriptional regulator [Lactiplantibacillus pentosus]EIW12575.1 transcription regulator, RpiR family [Lactiplantibacillus pentosus KCA1]EQM52920.1 RpiR family transcriptional regulator [Lactiplantibacillus plantarum EGD-AQ4]
MSIVNTVEEAYSSLSRQERKVALKVIQEPKQVQKMTISSLAKDADVSNATITRFVKKMGCESFYAFKILLAESPSNPVATASTQDTVADQVYSYYQKILSGTRERLDSDNLHAAVDLISKARRVYLYGLGSSGYTAQEMTQRLIRMGIAAFSMTDTHIMYISGGIMQPGDVILAISLTGETIEVNSSVALAKKKHAQVIAITSDEQSRLAELSDLTLLVKNSKFVNNSRFVNSQFAITYELDIIAAMLLENAQYRDQMNHTIDLITDNKFGKH